MMTCCVSLAFGCLMERLGSGAGCRRQGRATCFCQGPGSTGFRLGAMIRLCLSSRDDGAGTGGGRAQQSCFWRRQLEGHVVFMGHNIFFRFPHPHHIIIQ